MAKRKRSSRGRSPKMTARRRKSLSSGSFGLPGQRKYPLDTCGRAANAKARASQQLKKGRLSRSQYNQIVAAANRKLKACGAKSVR